MRYFFQSRYHECQYHYNKRGRRARDRMVVGFTTTYAISATDVVSSNLDQGEVYNIM